MCLDRKPRNQSLPKWLEGSPDTTFYADKPANLCLKVHTLETYAGGSGREYNETAKEEEGNLSKHVEEHAAASPPAAATILDLTAMTSYDFSSP